jgi:hypothetical protein
LTRWTRGNSDERMEAAPRNRPNQATEAPAPTGAEREVMEMPFYNGACVDRGIPIDPAKLYLLASALCDEGSWHRDSPRVTKSERDAADERYEREVKERGYCRECENLAGFILSKFDITERAE